MRAGRVFRQGTAVPVWRRTGSRSSQTLPKILSTTRKQPVAKLLILWSYARILSIWRDATHDKGALNVRLPMVRPRRKPRLVLSLAEEDKLLAAASPHLRNIIITALGTGMRRANSWHNAGEHIDFSRQLICATKSKTGVARVARFR